MFIGVGPDGAKKLQAGTFKNRAVRSRFSSRGIAVPSSQLWRMPRVHRMYSARARILPPATSSRYTMRLRRSDSRAATGSTRGSIASRRWVQDHVWSSPLVELGCPQGAIQHHDHVLAHDDGIRAANRGLRGQQSGLHVQHPEADEGMRDQHPDGGAGGQSSGLRKYLRSRGRQVQGLSTYASSRVPGECTTHRRVLCESRMQGRRYTHGSQVQLLHLGGPESVDRPVNEAPADNSSSGKRGVYGCWQNDQVAVEDEITFVVKNEMPGARSFRLPSSPMS